uniref:Protein Shroom1 n=1 Tax=Anas platyrhynchos TaxID=8839 RepID=A0A8B9SM05_ANAPL
MESSRVSPVTSLGSTEQLLHLPGRADSAYSSFSGGSNIPEYPTPSCYGEHCSLPPEQVPYMDSEYVRGIYNLSAANADLRWLPPHKAPDPGQPGHLSHRQTTPMLYYLAGGKATNILHHHKLAPCQEGSRSSPEEFPTSSQANDYREKLKVAQKKVLRETSFKRKDLQMSLPVRLRQKPSKRPSIEHLRSFSLSWEIERPQRGQTGGRKRETKEEKKLCYSEPEKLDQLADKEAPWNQARGRALSSSSISRTELKQIQHTALVEYMERTISQRPGGTQHIPLHKPPLQKRPSLPKWPPSNPNGSRKMQSDEVFCQASSEEPPPDVFSPSALVLPPRTCCHTVLAESDQGDKNEPRGLFAKEAAVLDSPEDIRQERETNPSKRRLGSAEDQRYQELAMEIVAKDSSLVDILMPYPVRKTALDLMEGLFPADVSMLDKSHRRKADGQQLELVSSLRSKLQVLWEDRELVLSEASECAARGKELEATVHDVCKPNEFERYLMFIGDLEKVVSLLLCLSSRLARVQNAMRKIDSNTDAEEKQSLNERHKLLSRQREDAKDLKENLDRRGRVVSGILAKYLTEQQLQDYRRFVQEKTSLLIEQKDLEEQIKFFEEQLENLEKKNSHFLSSCLPQEPPGSAQPRWAVQ